MLGFSVWAIIPPDSWLTWLIFKPRKQIFLSQARPFIASFKVVTHCGNSRYVPVGVHHVHVCGWGHAGVSVAAGVGADVAVGNLEVLRRGMVGWVGTEVNCVVVGGCLLLSSGIVPTLRGDGVRSTVGRSWGEERSVFGYRQSNFIMTKVRRERAKSTEARNPPVITW